MGQDALGLFGGQLRLQLPGEIEQDLLGSGLGAPGLGRVFSGQACSAQDRLVRAMEDLPDLPQGRGSEIGVLLEPGVEREQRCQANVGRGRGSGSCR